MSTNFLFLLLQGLCFIHLATACGRLRCCTHYYYGNLEDKEAVVESRYIRQSSGSPAPEADCGRGVYVTELPPFHAKFPSTKEKMARRIYGSRWTYALDNNKLDYSIGFNLKYSELEVCNKSGIYLLVYRKDINVDELSEYEVAKNDATTCRSGKGIVAAGLLFCAAQYLQWFPV